MNRNLGFHTKPVQDEVVLWAAGSGLTKAAGRESAAKSSVKEGWAEVILSDVSFLSGLDLRYEC